MFDPLQQFFGITISHANSPILWWVYSVLVVFWCFFIPLSLITLRLRIAPAFFMRGWFFVASIVNLSVIRVGAEIINVVATKILGKTPEQAVVYHATWCHYTFKLQTLLNPQIQVRGCSKKSWETLSHLPERAFICLNHTSQYDPFVFVGWIPLHIITTCRTLYKYSLRKTPIFGRVYDFCGHFPVYFKSGESFSVDADKQKTVTDQMIKFVDEDKGRLSMFPEGQLNKNPSVIQPFRYGSLKFALEHKMPIYFCVLWGPQNTWPVADSMGGLPADISFAVEKFELKDYDAALNDVETFATNLQAQMQSIVDTLSGATAKKEQ